MIVRRRLDRTAIDAPPVELPLDPLQFFIAGVVLWFAQQVGAASASMLGLIDPADHASLRSTAALLFAGAAAAAVAWTLLVLTLPAPARAVGLLWPPSRAHAHAGLIAFALIFPIVMTVGSAAAAIDRFIQGPHTTTLAHQTLRALAHADAITHHTFAWLLTIVGVVLVVPCLEELIYRGFLQSSLREAFRTRHSADRRYAERVTWGAILLTSSIFTAMHAPIAEPRALPALFVLSICLGVAYERTRSLWPPMLIHALFNFANLLLALPFAR